MKLLLGAIISLSASVAFAQAPLPGASPLLVNCGTADQKAQFAKAQLSNSATPDADLVAANAAIALGKAQHAKALDGRPVDDAFKSASWFGGLAKAASDPEVAELFRRTARDQLYRDNSFAATRRVSWATGLSDAALAYAHQVLAGEGCAIDDDNRLWLENRITSRGWFKISTYGADADKAAFLLAQHADRDPDFQGQVLLILEPLVSSGETKSANFAYLFDRVAAANNRLQRYGTQGRCLPAGWTPVVAIENADSLDARRAALGLPPHRDYIKRCVPRSESQIERPVAVR